MPGAVFLSGALCDTEDVFHVHNCAKSLGDQGTFCHVAVQFLSLVRDNLCIQRCGLPYPLPFFFCCDRLHSCVIVCASSRCGGSYRFLHLLWGQTVIGCILEKGQEGLDVSRRGSHPSYASQIGERRVQLRQAGMDTPCLEFPVNRRMPTVCQCVKNPKCSDGQKAYSLGRVQTATTP